MDPELATQQNTSILCKQKSYVYVRNSSGHRHSRTLNVCKSMSVLHTHWVYRKWITAILITQSSNSYIRVTEAEANIVHLTHLYLLLLSLQAPHTMPAMSSTPRAPATTPPRNRPTAVALLESVLAGLTFSASTGSKVIYALYKYKKWQEL